MKANIKATLLELTPSLKFYIEKKLAAIEKLIRRFKKKGVVEAKVEVGRLTKHHHKGDVFYAEINLRLPGKLLRASEKALDLRSAIDIVKDIIHLEIEKYKTRESSRNRKSGTRE